MVTLTVTRAAGDFTLATYFDSITTAIERQVADPDGGTNTANYYSRDDNIYQASLFNVQDEEDGYGPTFLGGIIALPSGELGFTAEALLDGTLKYDGAFVDVSSYLHDAVLRHDSVDTIVHQIFGGPDTLYGLDGNDLLDGGGGNDHIYGGKGDDTIIGGSGDDVIDPGSGQNVVDAGAGNDIVNGSLLFGRSHYDQISGGSGDDILIGYSVDAGIGDDMVTARNANGGDGDDHISAVAADGGNGNDVLTSIGDHGSLSGGEGDDILYGLQSGFGAAGGEGNDTCFAFEKVYFSGSEVGTGVDTLNLMFLASGKEDVSTFEIFNSTVDHVGLSATAFPALASGISASNFHVGKTAADADDFLLYKDGGRGDQLYYDPDANGPEKAIKILELRYSTGALTVDNLVLVQGDGGRAPASEHRVELTPSRIAHPMTGIDHLHLAIC